MKTIKIDAKYIAKIFQWKMKTEESWRLFELGEDKASDAMIQEAHRYRERLISELMPLMNAIARAGLMFVAGTNHETTIVDICENGSFQLMDQRFVDRCDRLERQQVLKELKRVKPKKKASKK